MAFEPALLGETLRAGAARLEKSKTPLLDARILMKFVTGLDDAGLIANSGAHLPEERVKSFYDLIDRRSNGEPVAYLTGIKEFWSLPIKVSPDVLIPRNDSECLIETALERRDKKSPLKILDLGTGSGCLLLALLTEFPQARGVGIDRSLSALNVARENADRLRLSDRADFIPGDWFSAVRGKFDIIISNPPYIPDGDLNDLPADVSAYEPREALFAGQDGMDAHRAILSAAPDALTPGGLLILECGADQAGFLKEMAANSFSTAEIFIINDLEGRNRGIAADLRRKEIGD